MRVPRWSGLLGFVLGVSCLLAAWIFGNPPGAAPDEPSHYVRAVGAASGDILGQPGGYGKFPRYTPLEHKYIYNSDVPFQADLTPFKGVNAYTRAYQVPSGLEPVTLGCDAFQLFTSAKCVYGGKPATVTEDFLSQHAGQNPLPYLVAGPFMVQANTPQRADWVGRCVLALFCLLLVGIPLAVTGKIRERLLLGLVASLTPMAVFTGAIVNPSGIEVFGSVGFFISLLALAEGRYPRGALAAAGFTGTVCCMSRPFGALWIIVSLVAVFGLAGKGALWQGIRRLPWASALTAFVIFLGAVSTFAVLTSFTEPAKVPVDKLPAGIFRALGEQAVGNFGWVDSPMPAGTVDNWLIFMIALTVLALIIGNWRERFTVLGTVVFVYALTYVLELKVLLPEQIGEQGRHSLPIFILVPLTTVYVLTGQRARIRLVLVGIPVLLMLFLEVVGWLANGARQGLGKPAFSLNSLPDLSGKLLNGSPLWVPPGGFLPWFCVLVLGCLLLLLVSGQSLHALSVTNVAAPSGERRSAQVAAEAAGPGVFEPVEVIHQPVGAAVIDARAITAELPVIGGDIDSLNGSQPPPYGPIRG